jgi:hypothetical protein
MTLTAGEIKLFNHLLRDLKVSLSLPPVIIFYDNQSL